MFAFFRTIIDSVKTVFELILMIIKSIIQLMEFIPRGLNMLTSGLAALPGEVVVFGTVFLAISIVYFIYFTVRGAR